MVILEIFPIPTYLSTVGGIYLLYISLHTHLQILKGGHWIINQGKNWTARAAEKLMFLSLVLKILTSLAVADIPISWTFFKTSSLKSFEYILFPESVWLASIINPPLLWIIMWFFRFFFILKVFPQTSQATGWLFWCCFWWFFKALGSANAFPHCSQQWGFSPVCWRVWMIKYCLVV